MLSEGGDNLIKGGKLDGGGKWLERGREVGERGRKLGFGTPLSTPAW